MFTRTLRSCGSSVIGSGNVPSSRSGPLLAISPKAHGPWKYIAASPLAEREVAVAVAAARGILVGVLLRELSILLTGSA